MTSNPQRESAPATRGITIRWASWYDAMNRWAFLGRERQFREWTVDLAAIRPGDAVLDVGCGTGNLTLTAKDRAGMDGEVCGIDAAPEMVQYAQRKAADRQIDVPFQVGLIEDIPFPDATFDVAFSSLMLHHLPEDLKRKGIAEIARALKPGGRFVAVDIDPLLMGNLRIVEAAMQSNGFAEIRRGRTRFRTMLFLIHYLSGTIRGT